jgi:hypothetical protein
VPTPREERIASNEALFRHANERMAGWEERQESEGPQLYLCECADPDCKQKVALSRPEYEAARSDSRRFFVVSGHEVLDVESVIENHGEWLLIEKDPEVTELVEDLDPRKDA